MQINHDFFQKFRILDGGVGQELLARGVKPVSNLWSTTALLKKEYHNILLDCHIDFINAGAEIILTNTFGSRRRRLEENNLLSEFENLNRYNPLAITGSCVSYEDIISIKNDFKNLSLPFGFKVNAFKDIPEGWKPDGSNPFIALGKNEDLNLEKFKTISKEFLNFGAKLLGGCCEITPSHIAKLQDLR